MCDRGDLFILSLLLLTFGPSGLGNDLNIIPGETMLKDYRNMLYNLVLCVLAPDTPLTVWSGAMGVGNRRCL